MLSASASASASATATARPISRSKPPIPRFTVIAEYHLLHHPRNGIRGPGTCLDNRAPGFFDHTFPNSNCIVEPADSAFTAIIRSSEEQVPGHFNTTGRRRPLSLQALQRTADRVYRGISYDHLNPEQVCSVLTAWSLGEGEHLALGVRLNDDRLIVRVRTQICLQRINYRQVIWIAEHKPIVEECKDQSAYRYGSLRARASSSRTATLDYPDNGNDDNKDSPDSPGRRPRSARRMTRSQTSPRTNGKPGGGGSSTKISKHQERQVAGTAGISKSVRVPKNPSPRSERFNGLLEQALKIA